MHPEPPEVTVNKGVLSSHKTSQRSAAPFSIPVERAYNHDQRRKPQTHLPPLPTGPELGIYNKNCVPSLTLTVQSYPCPAAPCPPP